MDDQNYRSLSDGDVFPLYERNMNFYRCCKTNGKSMQSCITKWRGECYCHEIEPVQPIMIGDPTLPCRMEVRTYIPMGATCPICIEGIYSKKNAYLTGCGHAFHKSCIKSVLQFRGQRNLICPFCRANLGRPEIKGRYGHTNSELDCLENFWMEIDNDTLKTLV